MNLFLWEKCNFGFSFALEQILSLVRVLRKLFFRIFSLFLFGWCDCVSVVHCRRHRFRNFISSLAYAFARHSFNQSVSEFVCKLSASFARFAIRQVPLVHRLIYYVSACCKKCKY